MKKTIGFLTAAVVFAASFLTLSHRAMAADDDANRKILRDAAVGAATGVAAVEGTKDEPKGSVQAQNGEPRKDHDKDGARRKGHRPPGWDKGKKEGWNGGDTPPGFKKGEKEGWDNKGMPPGLEGGSQTPGRGHGHDK